MNFLACGTDIIELTLTMEQYTRDVGDTILLESDSGKEV